MSIHILSFWQIYFPQMRGGWLLMVNNSWSREKVLSQRLCTLVARDTAAQLTG